MVKAELGVGGLPDLAHPAFAEEGGDVVVPEAGAGSKGHGGLHRPLYRNSGADWNVRGGLRLHTPNRAMR